MTSELKNSFFDYTVQSASKNNYDLSQHKGKVVLAVNVASKCGLTPQYAGLESLYKELGGKDFVILGFPCNQFGAQEPGTNEEIQSFCSMNYGVSFPILDKVDVNGKNTAPIYQFMKSQAPGILGTEDIKWNFGKFLIAKDGQVIKRYAPTTEPKDLISDIKSALA
ncbi:MAG: glutathione peroxidase [Bdellovibrionales bacterium RIFCSPHIGHO2_01_FULL_40_29]|nr:MAG: glutathione peroxidase [Bdellovibrionales bacterium RIFCSPHIGHO2_01_FULL_40_29]OFZ35423.1 MAG: glutathione peroxidase [Bdellovibrionales bacterium RIFCSPHIGHO2_02_FULL_40_15]